MPAGPVEGLTGKTVNGETLRVREVWADNLHEEIAIIRDIVEDYPYVAMDTEFPGVVARPVGNFKSSREYHYKVSTWGPGMVSCAACCFGWGRWLSAVGPVLIFRPAQVLDHSCCHVLHTLTAVADSWVVATHQTCLQRGVTASHCVIACSDALRAAACYAL
jgi:hypothetical protein